MAARSAICSRVRRVLDIALPRGLHNAIHKNRRGDDHFRVELARRDDFFYFHDREFRRSGHNRIEISSGLTIDQVPHVVRAVRANKGVVRAKRLLQDVTFSPDFTLLFATGDFSSHPDRREKCRDACAERAHPFAQDSLGHKLELDFSNVKLLLKIFRTRTGESCNDSPYLPILEKNAELAFAGAAIVADNTKVL